MIPDLTYEAFVEFHRRYYSPTNARFIFYGDLTLVDNLSFLESVLAPFERVEVDSRLSLQEHWDAPRTIERTYPVGAEDATAGKSFVCLAWLLHETTDVQAGLDLDILTDALVGSPAAPVRKALIDSGLGQDIFPAGYSGDARQAWATVGLRGTDADQADKIEQLVLDTLGRVAEEGLSPELIEGSMHQIEFSGKEISPPFPIWILVRAQAPWYADGDPKWGLQFSQLVERTRERFAADPDYFNRLIRECFLDNPHRLRLSVSPSTTLATERETVFADRMATLKSRMSPEELTAVQDQVRELREAQQAGDSPEALAKLPSLSVDDIPDGVRAIPTARREFAGVVIDEHEVFSNGVGYVGLSFDTHDLDDTMAIQLPLLGRLTCGMGAAGLTYEQMSNRIVASTGGLSSGNSAGLNLRSGEQFSRFTLDGKALLRNASELTGIMRDVLLCSDTEDGKRAGDLVQESASRAASRMIPSGHMLALVRAAASLGRHFWRREQWEGATQVRFLKQLSGALEARIGEVLETTARLRSTLFTRARLSVNVAGDPEILEAFRPRIEALIEAIPAGEPAASAQFDAPDLPRDAGIVIPAEVNYVSQVLPVPNLLDPAAASLDMLANILAADYLYQQLRVQGGAYGGFAAYMPEPGALALLSYRDPHLIETLNVYAGIIEYVSESLTDEAVDASRIGAVGAVDRILAPGQQLSTARRRGWCGITDGDRERYRSDLIGVTADQLRELAVPHLVRELEGAPRAVVASRERLEEANRTLEPALALFFTE